MTTNDMAERTRLSERVAEEIRALLARRRMSGRELARRLGASPSWVNFRLTGAQPIDLNDLERIAAVLDVDIVDLFPQREGKLIAVGGTSRTPGRESKPCSFRVTKQPGPKGPPSRSTATPVNRRTGRVHAALAAA